MGMLPFIENFRRLGEGGERSYVRRLVKIETKFCCSCFCETEMDQCFCFCV